MAAPMKTIIIIFVLTFLLHSDFVCVQSTRLRDQGFVVVHDDSFADFSPFSYRHIRSLGFHSPKSRQKRETFSTAAVQITVPENKTDPLYQFTDTSRAYTLVSVSVPSVIELSGYALNANRSTPKRGLDYEDPKQRTITVVVNGTKNFDDVKQITVTITVTNVNDEDPVFKNEPHPFLATVSANTAANIIVYDVFAEDPDPGSDIRYSLESGGEGRFRLETKDTYDNDLQRNIKIGRIFTEGQGQFVDGKRYDLVVVAQDTTATPPQRTLATVQVLVGVRPPQFYKEDYHGYVLENNGIDQTLQGQLKVKAKPFQETEVSYKLFDSNNATSAFFRIDNEGTVKTLQTLDYESVPKPQRPPKYRLQIKATESKTGLYSYANLVVEVKDSNDNDPTFDLSRYTTTVSEDIRNGTEVMRVTANDNDDGINAELVYSVNDDSFYVDTQYFQNQWIGIIRVRKELDYDSQIGHLYTFDIKAEDKGVPVRTGTAKIRVFTTNVNDNPPALQSPTSLNLQENAPVHSVVTLLNAVDKDGDNFKFYFSGQRTQYAIFEIIPDSGLIKTTAPIPQSINLYSLNITITDDGSCCQPTIQLSTETYIVVEITDINDHKPSFTNCTKYSNIAKVKENKDPGTHVITVSAVDEDRGNNGRVSYEILRGDAQTTYFTVDRTSGDISTATPFDRESTRFLSITVVGRDGGSPTLEGYCTFRVYIDDVNDNPPKFDQSEYEATIPQSLGSDRSVITVRATDADAGDNAVITYSIVANGDSSNFRIDPDIGVIRLNKTVLHSAYYFDVMATDHGIPPLNSTVRVTVRVANLTSRPPSWENPNPGPFTINETAQFGYEVARFTAKSNVVNPVLSFHLINDRGNPVQRFDPFAIRTAGDTVILVVQGVMNYNKKKSYQLTLRVTNRGAESLSTEIHPLIKLIDTNNEIPVFDGLDKQSGYYPGSVVEEQSGPQTVIEIKAYDADQMAPNNVLTYTLKDPSNAPGNAAKFYLRKVDDNTVIVMSNFKFDRESTPTAKVYVDIEVKDGAPSTLTNDGKPNSAVATIEVTIQDMNDNDPYFPHPYYNTTIREDAEVGSKVILVEARDIDSAASLVYSISGGNTRNAFKVQEKDGQIMVGRRLDYENPLDPKVYELEMTVNDGLHTNTTKVYIHIQDANDNSPKFDMDPYIITDVVEDDPNISGQNPLRLLKVVATDADKDRPTNIQYTLMGSESKNFYINKDTGELFLLNSLDRDAPNGKALYQFNVRAQDEVIDANYGYATVQVKPIDLNDNAPFNSKNSLTGNVSEHSEPDTFVMNVVFEDYDEAQNGTAGLTYRFVQGEIDNKNNIMFKVDNNGLIKTNTSSKNLDREQTAQYKPVIVVTDGGPDGYKQSTTATLTINLRDINDQKPVFQRKIYQVEMSENQKSGQIARVVATDNDIDLNAKLQYSLVSDAEFFRIDTINNEGSIIVVQAVDYEKPNQQFFNITVKVQDPDPRHTDFAYVELTVTDFNDNEPKFDNPLQTKSFYEDISVGTSIASFTASDLDSGINKEFSFSIERTSDPDKLFIIDQTGQTGTVKTRKMLDREKEPLHILHILAIDKGDPARTGTATLSVSVLDINDNAPIFAGDYHPVVMENDKNYPKLVIKVNGTDLDADPYGPPFGFSDLCPAHDVCNYFSLKYQPEGDGGKGWALVSTKTEYDREKQKYYYMPIVMWDMRGQPDAATKSKTGTNTLTIEIGDENDNKHGPGHKDIFVYNYKGLFGDIEIGNVYATDPDDWDRVDKNFIFIGPDYMKKYFVVDENTGVIRMQKGVPAENSPYTFTVRVIDNKWQGLAADCSVTVTIQDLPEEAVYNSGAVRLTGITAEEFVDRKKKATGDIRDYEDSKYDKFRLLLSQKLQVPLKNVDIISVMNNKGFTDVRYSAHGSPYYPSERTDAILKLNQKQFETDIGIKIAMVPIDECQKEMFEGGCYNYLNVSGKPNLVNTNGTSIIGVETSVQAKEGCRGETFPPVQRCDTQYCMNGGTCNLDDWGELSCQCPYGFNGPRCQQTHHSFDGNSYSLFRTLEQCKKGTTSIEFITVKESGLIMYSGPERDLAQDEPRDFISLELDKGYPKLRIDHGSGELVLLVDGRDSHNSVIMQKLNDGKWHRVDIVRDGQDVEIIVDHCDAATRSNDDTDVMCRKAGRTPGVNEFLNVNTFLYLGGVNFNPTYPGGLQQLKFDGCVKNLMHNGLMYDLTVKESPGYPSGKPGCSREDEICKVNGVLGSACGDHGECVATWSTKSYICICKPKWRGEKCDRQTTTKDMKTNSYFEWHLNNKFYNNLHVTGDWKLQLHIMFRTRDQDGVLLTVSSANGSQVITLQIIKSRLTLTYNLDRTNRNLELYYKDVSNGQWHVVEMQRYGREFILKMDNGEGRNYNRTRIADITNNIMIVSTTVHAGAILSQSSGVTVVDKDLENTCVNDIRMNNRYFPMSIEENSADLAATLTKNPNIADGCVRDDCMGVTCTPPEVCYPLWSAYECRCPEHYEMINGRCIAIAYCKNHRCFSDSTCVEDTSKTLGYRCECPPGWTGDFCNQLSEAYTTTGITTGAIAAIVISIFVLLLLALAVILLVKCGRPKKADDKYILEVDSYDDIRENVINYDEEGAGEEDQEGYDMSRLRKPEDSHSLYKPPLDSMTRRDIPLTRAPGETPDVGNFINDRLGDADQDGGAPPYDSVREFVYEGGDSDAGSLSSLNTTSSTRSQDYDYLNDWGPKFAKLADMYGAGQEPEED